MSCRERTPTPGSDWPDAGAPAYTFYAPAKVNLFLELLGLRPDGYRELETLMLAVSLYDRLQFVANDRLTLTCDRPDLPTGPENLVIRAAELLRRETGCRDGANIHLRKRIPVAAGLAGGSSDCAAALVGLNLLWNLGLSRGELARLSAQLGSDIAFFFYTPLAWCTGHGEIVTPALLGRPLYLALAQPPVGLSTAAVYAESVLPERPIPGTDVRKAAASGDPAVLGRALFNRLQAPAERLCPAVSEVVSRLRALGPAGAQMSGSGSCAFALADNRAGAVRLARTLKTRPGPCARAWAVRSCS